VFLYYLVDVLGIDNKVWQNKIGTNFLVYFEKIEQIVDEKWLEVEIY